MMKVGEKMKTINKETINKLSLLNIRGLLHEAQFEKVFDNETWRNLLTREEELSGEKKWRMKK